MFRGWYGNACMGRDGGTQKTKFRRKLKNAAQETEIRAFPDVFKASHDTYIRWGLYMDLHKMGSSKL